MSGETVILVHGVWMRALVMLALRKRLRAAGFVSELFDYASVLSTHEASVARLLRRMTAHAGPVHVVGHSLGGLLALQAARQCAPAKLGRLVCLGSPLNGSAVARRIRGVPAGAWMLGQHRELLCSGIERWQGESPVGVIAGTQSLGWGTLMGGLAGPNDGTVHVAETRLDGVTAHCEVAVSHTGLVYSARVADLTAQFLQQGHFGAPASTLTDAIS